MENVSTLDFDTIARFRGQAITELPKDLYIPPDALEVFLEAFEGPLDLLLYLIKKHNMDILDIPIVSITEQYMQYVDVMKELHIELAAEYLVMAAMLAEIKSRVLLPRPEQESEESDPRAELVRRLQEYERFKAAAEDLDSLSQEGRDVFAGKIKPPDLQSVRPLPDVALKELLLAFQDVMQRAKLYTQHEVLREPLSVRERMSLILDRVAKGEYVEFATMFTMSEGRMGVVVTLIAILELLRESLLEIVQADLFSPIYLKAK